MIEVPRHGKWFSDYYRDKPGTVDGVNRTGLVWGFQNIDRGRPRI